MPKKATVRGRSTSLAERFEEARLRGVGIQPGAGSKRKTESLGSLVGKGVRAVKRAVVPQARPATKEEEESYKLRGQKAYYDAKIKRLRKK